MNPLSGDVLEICEESDAEDVKVEDSEDKQPHLKHNVTRSDMGTVSFQDDVSEDLKKPRSRKRRKLTRNELSQKRKLTQERKLLGLVRPDVTTNRERERLLKRIATKGVVQLFNAVAERQRLLAEELSKKMTAKERREAIGRLQGNAFRVHPGNTGDTVLKNEVDGEDEVVVKKEEAD